MRKKSTRARSKHDSEPQLATQRLPPLLICPETANSAHYVKFSQEQVILENPRRSEVAPKNQPVGSVGGGFWEKTVAQPNALGCAEIVYPADRLSRRFHGTHVGKLDWARINILFKR